VWVGALILTFWCYSRLGTLHNARIFQQRRNGDRPLTPFQHGLAGLAGGLTVSFVATPVEQIKARLQVQYDSTKKVYSGPIDCVRQVVRNNGIQGLWTGLLPTMLFRSWFFVFWGSYDVRNRSNRKRKWEWKGLMCILILDFCAKPKKSWTEWWVGDIPCWWHVSYGLLDWGISVR
jgi:hypothetical protein